VLGCTDNHYAGEIDENLTRKGSEMLFPDSGKFSARINDALKFLPSHYFQKIQQKYFFT
jgi:hypothetical protein